MVARITTPKSLQKTLNYNEQKVQKGVAVCLGEQGFLLPLVKMNFYDKLERFERRNGLNDRASTKTLHVSLNFSPEEQYAPAFYMQIAREYMAEIGFADQPFLVYQHRDAGHPHVHIVSTLIRSDGTRIDTHKIGRTKSEAARKMLEEKYGLVKAENSRTNTQEIVPFDLRKVAYGKDETRRGIEEVLRGVVNTYNYTSLAELNAILKQFNVMADRCAPDGFIYSKRGLYYRVLDANGVRIGVPIKASRIARKPTLDQLEKRFVINTKHREPLREKLKEIIAGCLLVSPRTIAELSALLSKEKVTVVRRENEQGKLYGITFVDHTNKCVFNGSEIDRQYSVAGLLKLMDRPATEANTRSSKIELNVPQQIHEGKGLGLLEFNGLAPLAALIAAEEEYNPTPYQLKRKKRRRKR